jgi:phage tail P2-like protein
MKMSDARGITQENLLSTFPDVLRKDESLFALATVAAKALAARPAEIELLRIYPRIDELPEELLDILAYDFKVDWWDANYSLEEKRQTLKDSWGVHRKLGTKAAVERAISAIYKDTKVSEWFDYGGAPNHFKLQIDATYEHVGPVKHQRVLGRVAYYKNLRSVLDNVEYVANPHGSCMGHAGVAAIGMAVEITVEVQVYGLG